MYIFLLTNIQENTGFLSAEESEHCLRVLRKTVGEEIYAIDGKGTYYVCLISVASKKGTEVFIKQRIANWGEKKDTKMILAISPLKQKERFEWLVEKSVELGVDDIVPLICKHTITDNIKPERLHNVMVAALKQCKRSKLPTLHEPTDFQQFVTKTTADIRLFCYCTAETPIFAHQAAIQAAKTIVLAIGPEGDFSTQEAELALKSDFLSVSLGESRLRTETAGLCALSMLKGIKGW